MGKRSITPVIAVILLILMTISISALTFSWLRDMFTQQREAIEAQQETFKITLFDIQRAWFDTTNDNIVNLYLYNRGQSDIFLDRAIYTFEAYSRADNTLVQSGTLEGSSLGVSGVVRPGEYEIVTINTSDPAISFFNRSALSDYILRIIILYRDATASYTIS